MAHSHDRYDRWIHGVCTDLDKLIQLDVDAIGTYREAIAHVADRAARTDVELALADHERHVEELTMVIRELGGTPNRRERDFKGMLLERMARLRSRGTVGALRALRLAERLTNRSYDKTSHAYMPPIGQIIVIENLDDERRHLAAFEGHIARLTGTESEARLPIGPERSQHPLYTH